MRTSEFKEAVEALGYTFKVDCDGDFYIISGLDEISFVSKNKTYVVHTAWSHFRNLEETKKDELFSILTIYASTPIAEREEEKRYRLKLVNKTVDDNASYLNKTESEGKYFVSNKFSIFGKVESIFTESELKTMDLTGFEKVEVTE